MASALSIKDERDKINTQIKASVVYRNEEVKLIRDQI